MSDYIKTNIITIEADMDTSSGDIHVSLDGPWKDLLFLCGVIIHQVAASESDNPDDILMKAISVAASAALSCSEDVTLVDVSGISADKRN